MINQLILVGSILGIVLGFGSFLVSAIKVLYLNQFGTDIDKLGIMLSGGILECIEFKFLIVGIFSLLIFILLEV
jgi:hypothetical protein